MENIEEILKEKETGIKYDSDKLRWDLLPIEEVESIVAVLTFGANKYKDNNWMLVENGVERYFAAAMRHITAWRKGEIVDRETGISHLVHAMTNLIFIEHLQKTTASTLTTTTQNKYYEQFR